MVVVVLVLVDPLNKVGSQVTHILNIGGSVGWYRFSVSGSSAILIREFPEVVVLKLLSIALILCLLLNLPGCLAMLGMTDRNIMHSNNFISIFSLYFWFATIA